MRRLLLFLLLFAGGVAVLWQLERRESGEVEGPDEPPVAPPEAPRPARPVRQEQAGIGLSGAFQADLFDEETGRIALRVASVESATEEGVDRLEDVTIELYDPETEEAEVRGTIHADRAFLPRSESDGLEMRYAGTMRVEGVEGWLQEVLEGSTVHLRTPAARIDASDPDHVRLDGEAEIALASPELEARGVGYHLDLIQPRGEHAEEDLVGPHGPEDVVELRREGLLSFRRETAEDAPADAAPPTGHLRATGEGPLQIRRRGARDPRPISFEVWDGGELELRGREPSRLVGERLLVAGMSVAETETVEPERIQAEGGVRWLVGSNLFTGERCEMVLEEGRTDVTLSGQPRARLLIDLSGERETLGEAADQEVELAVSCEDEIRVAREDGVWSYVVSGPATVETQGVRLRSNGDLEGGREQDGTGLTFRGTGGVVIEGAGLDVEAAAFDLAMVREEGEPVARITASNGARVVGSLPDGRAFTVSSPDHLVVLRRGERMRVVDGKSVELSVADPDGEEELFARCDRLTDLDLEAMTFLAEGDVLYRRGDETARCQRLESEGEGRYTLHGEGDDRALLLSPFGEARADEVEVVEGEVRARGHVTATVTSLPEAARSDSIEFDSYELSGDALVLRRSQEELADGTLERRFTLDASGSIASRLVSGAQTLRLERARELQAARVDHLSGDGRDARRLGSTTRLRAEGDVVAHVTIEPDRSDPLEARDRRGRRTQRISELDVFCDRLALDRVVAEEDATEPELSVVAGGGVVFESTSELDFHGEGRELRLDPDGRAHLVADEGERVRLYGKLPTHGLPFELTADRADFTTDRIEAAEPRIVVSRRAAPETEAVPYEARSRRLIATSSSLELLQDVRLTGTTDDGSGWTMDARRILLEGTPGSEGSPAELSKISATGGVVFRLGEEIVAHADALFGVRPTGVLRMTGTPARIETPAFVLEADSFDFDPVLRILVESKGAHLRSRPAAGGDGAASGPGQDQEPPPPRYDLDLPNVRTFIDGDSLVVCWQEPTLVYREEGLPPTTVRASWAVFWIDREEYRALSDRERRERNRAAREELDAQKLGAMRIFFRFLEANGIVGLVREAYFEGPVEILSGEMRLARADSVYLDLTSGHGWLANATLQLSERVLGEEGEDLEEISVRARWLRHSANGSLRAENAQLTSCSLEVPHLTVETRDLRLVPKTNSVEGGYEVSLGGNSIDLPGLPRIPLGTIAFDTDENLEPQLPSLRFGNSARFGQLFALNVSGPAKGLGRWFDDLLTWGDGEEDAESDVEEEKEDHEEDAARRKEERRKRTYDARYDVDASYLGSRGALLDVGFSVEQREERYFFDFLTGIAIDDGEDKGYVEVPEDERDTTRLWLRSHGWMEEGRNRFLLAYSDQSDPGVQSEFYERDFVRYEEAESYLQWKRVDGHRFTQASVNPRVDEFRADVEELPAVTLFSGRAPLLVLGDLALVHHGELEAGYLRRRAPSTFDLDGDGIDDGPILSPFANDGVYPDPFDPTGDQEVVRADLVQTLELPIALGFAGLRLVPFASVRGTAWSEAADEEDATRLAVEAGARLATVLWRRHGTGARDQIAPYVAFRGEVDTDVEGTPHVFDATETAVFGDFVELGTRARFGVDGDRSLLDVDLRGVHASDRSDGRPDGWLPLEAFVRLSLAPGGQILDVWYDGRWDAEESEFVYSLFSLGTRFDDDVGLQLSHTYGRDEDLLKIFDALTISGFYRWTEKWEWEARQTFSFLAEERLGTSVILRRYGHDLIFEIETDVREGEGTSVNFSLRPLLGYRPSRIGYIRW